MSTVRDLAEEALEEVEQVISLRDLVESGGYPYIKVTIVDPEQGGVRIDTLGLPDDVDLAAAFAQLAELIRAGALEEVTP